VNGVRSRALDLLAQRQAVRAQLEELTQSGARDLQVPYPPNGSEAFADVLEKILERLLEQQGNVFAEAVRRQTAVELRHDLKAQAGLPPLGRTGERLRGQRSCWS
jgi:hypothetical protein